MRRQLQTIVLCLSTIISARAQSGYGKIDTLLNAYASVHKFNGTALVTQDHKTVYEKSFGYQDAVTKKLNTSNSIYPVGSLTKPFTALVILKLVEENKLSLTDPVSKFIPDYPRGSQIQLKHLLTHTAGIYEPLRNPKYLEQVVADHAFKPAEVMGFFKNEPLDFEPGSKFSYSNSGYDLLGVIIEKVTRLPYSAAVSKYIFGPLQMKKSGFNFQKLQDDNKVTNYAYLSPTRQAEVKIWNSNLTYSSGALYSTAGDLLKFYEGLSSFKIVSEQTLEQATNPLLGHYGYGWFLDVIHGDRVIDHGGNIPGATSYFLFSPEHQTCIILLNNITSTTLEKTGKSMYAALRNKPYSIPKPQQEIKLGEKALLRYTGFFEVSANYKLEISQEADKLFMRINNGDKVKLLAESENRFFINDEDMALEFISKDDKIVQLKIKQGLATKIADKI
ncbi:serine hydrolase [Hymenobacter sp. 15J16-1T3B]|uniref:serine hydrolase n=1 Tax=Hymenobacter sp. 15J16-1T3B TaxID=2886941 RepID=UPI001D12E45B|nr:serine hydrolase [Hymenobacter sp. 15J16-1T3B]MCC3158313.1 serine hydrolase [Hymenobacter sp. 15J16-1T3B]